jgi:hypothetical protein
MLRSKFCACQDACPGVTVPGMASCGSLCLDARVGHGREFAPGARTGAPGRAFLAGAGGFEPPPSALTVQRPADWTTPQRLLHFDARQAFVVCEPGWFASMHSRPFGRDIPFRNQSRGCSQHTGSPEEAGISKMPDRSRQVRTSRTTSLAPNGSFPRAHNRHTIRRDPARSSSVLLPRSRR